MISLMMCNYELTRQLEDFDECGDNTVISY